MDAIIRALKTGKDDGSAPCAVLVDSLDVIGGRTFMHKILGQLIETIVSGSLSPARCIVTVALEESPLAYEYLFRGSVFNKSNVVDCFTDPYGWIPQGSRGCSALFSFSRGIDDLLKEIIASTGIEDSDGSYGISPGVCIVFNSLTPLLDNFGPQQVSQLLRSVKSDPRVACVVCSIHSDLHSSMDVAAVTRVASCTATLYPGRGISIGYAPTIGELSDPLGKLSVRSRRRNGTVRVDNYEYWITPSSGLRCVSVTNTRSGTLDPSLKIGSDSRPHGQEVTAPPTAGVSFPVHLAGGMRLSVSEEEAAARAAVPLPYEHQGQGSLYTTSDYRDYLPMEAGGRKQDSSGRLGHILYVRDSDSDEPDSDEDPDDDLDI